MGGDEALVVLFELAAGLIVLVADEVEALAEGAGFVAVDGLAAAIGLDVVGAGLETMFGVVLAFLLFAALEKAGFDTAAARRHGCDEKLRSSPLRAKLLERLSIRLGPPFVMSKSTSSPRRAPLDRMVCIMRRMWRRKRCNAMTSRSHGLEVKSRLTHRPSWTSMSLCLQH